MSRILSVFGTRPEAIKMAPVVQRIEAEAGLESRVCVTGQHRQMLDSVLDVFSIRPDYDLRVMSPGQDLFGVTSRILEGMADVLDDVAPDMVLVHGDTTTCLAGSLASFYKRIPVAHVEAGLRSHDMGLPFPEEMNRAVVDRVSTLHFAPTESSRMNLLAEGIAESSIHVTGNTVIDALHHARGRALAEPMATWAPVLGRVLSERLQDPRRKVVLVTGHRRESFGQGFEELCLGLRESAQAHPDWIFVYPVHLNPNVRGPVHGKLRGLSNVFLIEPLDYLPFVFLMDRCDVVLTDSGGIQEEAPSLGKPVLVTRDRTERPEALEAGTVRLVGMHAERIYRGLEEVLGDPETQARMSRAINPYGDGCSAGRIARILRRWSESRSTATAARAA